MLPFFLPVSFFCSKSNSGLPCCFISVHFKFKILFIIVISNIFLYSFFLFVSFVLLFHVKVCFLRFIWERASTCLLQCSFFVTFPLWIPLKEAATPVMSDPCGAQPNHLLQLREQAWKWSLQPRSSLQMTETPGETLSQQNSPKQESDALRLLT